MKEHKADEQTRSFAAYIQQEWRSSAWLWMEAGRNFPHLNQDTNNLVESYHHILKELYLMRRAKSLMRVDYLIQKLLDEVHLRIMLKVNIVQSGRGSFVCDCYKLYACAHKVLHTFFDETC